MTENICNCPNCNDDTVFVLSERNYHQVKCPTCGVRGPECDTPEDAIQDWNTIYSYLSGKHETIELLYDTAHACKGFVERFAHFDFDSARAERDNALFRISELDDLSKCEKEPTND